VRRPLTITGPVALARVSIVGQAHYRIHLIEALVPVGAQYDGASLGGVEM
jgi:hypothetical protein